MNASPPIPPPDACDPRPGIAIPCDRGTHGCFVDHNPPQDDGEPVYDPYSVLRTSRF